MKHYINIWIRTSEACIAPIEPSIPLGRPAKTVKNQAALMPSNPLSGKIIENKLRVEPNAKKYFPLKKVLLALGLLILTLSVFYSPKLLIDAQKEVLYPAVNNKEVLSQFINEDLLQEIKQYLGNINSIYEQQLEFVRKVQPLIKNYNVSQNIKQNLEFVEKHGNEGIRELRQYKKYLSILLPEERKKFKDKMQEIHEREKNLLESLQNRANPALKDFETLSAEDL